MRSVILLLAGLLLFGCVAEDTTRNETPVDQTVQNQTQDATATVSPSELAMHNMETDCWVLHNGSVYDISGYVTSHPNYQNVITPYCGLGNGSFDDAFMGKHGSAMVDKLVEEGEPKGELEG